LRGQLPADSLLRPDSMHFPEASHEQAFHP
jgi:hypothetical protein